jgi:phosphoglycolate phosphatase-like HAD superfamily hydrolase
MDTLILFDIDGTLVKGSKGHAAAFVAGFKQVYDVDTDISVIRASGMTDQEIIIAVLKKNGLSEERIIPLLPACMKAMVAAYAKIMPNDHPVALPGVVQLLTALEKKAVLGLVTGNLEPIAHGKLARAGINHFFKVGGFGSDDSDRSTLAKLAVKRAESVGFAKGRVFSFGDAPQDIKAGKAAGARTIGVLTGSHSKTALEHAGADVILDDLRDTATILALLGMDK